MVDATPEPHVRNDVQAALPAFPQRLLTGTIIAALVAVVALVVLTFHTNNATRVLHEKTMAVAQAQSAVALEDEVLTMSAQMAAATGDPKWSARYDEHFSAMEKALNSAKLLAPDKSAESLVKEASDANEALVSLQIRAQMLASKGSNEAATAILEGPEFRLQKEKLSKASTQFNSTVNAAIAREREQLDLQTQIVIAVRFLILIGLALGWWWFTYTLKKWRLAMAGMIEHEHEISAENARQQAIIAAASDKNRIILEQTVAEVRNENKALNEAAHEQEALANRRLADSFESAIGGIADELGQLSDKLVSTAQTMDGAARNADQQFAEVTSAITTSSTEMLAVAATTDQLVASVREAGGHAASSADHLVQATREATGLVERVGGLAGSVQKIDKIVALIDQIARRTNMLALNATIEASRAGEAGHGFAVVAQEVKNLATQTAQATSEVASLIAKIHAETDEAMKSGAITAASMENVQEAAQAIGLTLAQQQVAIGELSNRANAVVSSNSKVTTGVAVVGETARKTGLASGEVLNTANVLAGQTDKLRDQILLVLGRLRAS
jgi:methyl-accepting chemotaxis protein